MTSLAAHAADPALQRAMDLAYNAQFDEAERLATGYVNSHPGDPQGYMVRATVLDWKQLVQNLRGKLDSRALEDYQTANKYAFLLWEKDQENVDKLVNLGNSYMFLAKKWLDLKKKSRAGLILKKCKKHMEDAIAKNPNRWEAYLAIGIFNFYAANIPPGMQFIASLLGISGNEKLGIEQLNKAATNPNLFQNHAAFMLAYSFGERKKNFGVALGYLNKLIGRFPQNPQFRLLKGQYAYYGKQYEASRKIFSELLNFCVSGKCARRYTFMSNYFIANAYVDENRVKEAGSYLDKAEKLNEDQYPDRTIRLHYLKGLVYKAEGNKKKAIKEFEYVKTNQSKNPQIWKKAEKELASMGKK